jgi:hypothetical protein
VYLGCKHQATSTCTASVVPCRTKICVSTEGGGAERGREQEVMLAGRSEGARQLAGPPDGAARGRSEWRQGLLERNLDLCHYGNCVSPKCYVNMFR